MAPQPVRVAIDLETTGLDAEYDSIIEIGAVKFTDAGVISSYETLVSPGASIPYRIQRLTGITPAQLRAAPPLAAALPDLRAFLGALPLVGHNVAFDAQFLGRAGVATRNPLIDTYELASLLLPSMPNYTLGAVGAALGVPATTHHRALADAHLSRSVLLALLERLADVDSTTLESLGQFTSARDWTPAPLIRAELNRRGRPASGMQPPTLISMNIGDQLATKLGVHPSVLTQPTGRAPAGLQKTDREVTRETSAVVVGADGSSVMEERMRPTLDQGGVLLLEIEHSADELAHCLAAALRWAADTDGRLVIVAADGAAMRALAQETVPAARRLAALDEDAVEVAELSERESYLCLLRWHGLARNSHLPLTTDATRGLTKLAVWLPQTATGARIDVTLSGHESAAWDRTRAGRAYVDSAATCPYGAGGYCYLTQAQTRAATAQVVLTTHAAFAASLVKQDDLLPRMDRVLVLDAHLLADELRQARAIHFDATVLFTLLDTLGATDRTGALTGLTPYVAMQLDANASRSRQRLWMEAIRRARERAHAFFAAMQAALAPEDDAHANGQSREHDARRIDSRMTQGHHWAAAMQSWEALATAQGALATLLREVAREVTQADKKLPGSGSGLPIELLGYARRLDDLSSQGARIMDGTEPEAVRWLRVPYPSTNDRGAVAKHTPRGRGKKRQTSPRAAEENMAPDAAPAAATSDALQEEYPALYLAHTRPEGVLDPLWRDGGLILASPALSIGGDFEFARASLAAPESASTASLIHDRSNQTLLCLPSDVPEPNMPHYQHHLDQTLIQLATALDGRLVAIFPSHAALRASYQGVRQALEGKNILVLAQGQDGSSRQLWHTFSTEKRVVLLGAGNFWDGAPMGDQPPACIVVSRLPLPALSDPLHAACADYWDDPQSQYIVPHAVLRVRRALLGLAWSHSTRNAVVLFDRRIQTRDYGHMAPGALPRCTQLQDPVEHLIERISEWVGPA